MVSRSAIFFAGVGTVVVAIGIGFGGALLITDTKPIHKEPPAAFAKRDTPLPIQTKSTDAAEPAPAAILAVQTIPKKVEDVAALKFLPPETTGIASTPESSASNNVAPVETSPGIAAPPTQPAHVAVSPAPAEVSAVRVETPKRDDAKKKARVEKKKHENRVAEKKRPAALDDDEREGPYREAYVERREPSRDFNPLGFLFGR